MNKVIISIALYMISGIALGDKAVLGYYYQTDPYNDYVIIYTYTRSDGTIGLSHCRTRSNSYFQYAFTQQTRLDINVCDLNYTPAVKVNEAGPPGAAAYAPLVNPATTTGFSTERAF